ncbi:hypothetical protein F5X68DRAFT_67827 [Plectosphaerella plurivora]|uniref:C2H2-type domain-containing protein n=1 Tax=Plectosphaerella plurivora TaxID=936078 RepID=A0A9P8V0G8_9PEZI|nr:hypothetical protein F5X68DRAFT_67827 [Plectosphaerella plurivora]
MTTSASRHSDQGPTGDYYDYDPNSSRGSPRMESINPDLGPQPSPKFATPRHVEHQRGEAVLIKYLGIGCKESGVYDAPSTIVVDGAAPLRLASPERSSPDASPEPPGSPNSSEPAPFNLKSLAAGALAFSTSGACLPSPQSSLASAPINPSKPDAVLAAADLHRQDVEGAAHVSRLPVRESRERSGTVVSGFSDPEQYPSRPSMTASRHIPDAATSTSPRQSASGGLPPLQIDSPRSDHSGHGRALPSIRQHFSDLQLSPDKDGSGRRHASSFSRSPPSGLPGISSMPNFVGPHPTSPTSPGSTFRRDLPSPQLLVTSSYGFHPYIAGRLSGGEHNTGSPDSPTSDQPPSLVANSAVDRLGADGMTGSNQHGTYVCTFPDCTAAPFQTQYLLNSHANVHSSARPHYCPVSGCSRSEGGKGFKRKNEMIRHGLVHESPGYVCPFCPDREHKYPRPDNLQRHVRVHHVDKDKDDPLLRDVLSQRPDGPNRGRRRRGLAM